MPNGIFINAKDIMILRGIKDYNNAWTNLKQLSKVLKKPSASSITVDEYAAYYKIEKSIILKALNDKCQ